MVKAITILLLCLPLIIISVCIIVGIVHIISLIKTGDYCSIRNNLPKKSIDTSKNIAASSTTNVDGSNDVAVLQALLRPFLISRMIDVLNMRIGELQAIDNAKSQIPAAVYYFDGTMQTQEIALKSHDKPREIATVSVTVNGKKYWIRRNSQVVQKEDIFVSCDNRSLTKFVASPTVMSKIKAEKRERPKGRLSQITGSLPATTRSKSTRHPASDNSSDNTCTPATILLEE